MAPKSSSGKKAQKTPVQKKAPAAPRKKKGEKEATADPDLDEEAPRVISANEEGVRR